MELEQSRMLLEKNGVRIAAVSYDSPETLAAFAKKHAIGFPLLSDRNSEAIRAFGIFNINMAPDLKAYGVPHPVEYLVSVDGLVVKKYFVPNYQHRVTASGIALREFGSADSDAPAVILESGALTVRIGFASTRAFAGQEVSFYADFGLQPGWHIYKTTSITFEGPAVIRQELNLPAAETLEGSFRAIGTLLLRFPLPEGRLVLPGLLIFQQCGDKVCEPPEAISFELGLTLEPFLVSEQDRQATR